MKIFQNTLKYTIILGLFLVPFIAFVVPKTMFFPFITGKGFTFRILVEIIFGLYLILAFSDPQYRPKNSWITKSILLFLGIMLVADLFSANPYKSLWSNYERMEGFVTLAHLFLFYLVATAVLNTKARWHQFFDVSIVSSVAMSIYGMLQIAGKLTINQGGVRVDGTLGNASYFAIYIVFNIFLCLYMYVNSTEVWRKWSYIIAAVLNLFVLYYTATRGAILGLIGGLILAGIIVALGERTNQKLKKIAISGLIAMFVLVLGFFSIRNTNFVKNSPVLSRFSSIGVGEIQGQARFYVWPMAIKGFTQSPKTFLIGWGQESFNFVFNKYYDPRMYNQEQWFDRTHDIFLDWLIAGGLLGLLSYLGIFVALMYYIWRKQSPLRLSEKSLLTGLMAGYLFHNTFVFDNLISYIYFFAILGFIHTVSTANEVKVNKFYTKVLSGDALNYVVLPVVVICTAAAVYFVNIPAILANQSLIQAISPQGDLERNISFFKKTFDYNSFGNSEAVEQAVQVASQVYGSTASTAAKQEFYELAKEKIEEKVKETPHDARYLVFAGSFYNRFAQYDDGIKYLTRALEESPNKQSIYFELGTSYLGKGDVKDAFGQFKAAYELATSASESKIIYALGAIYSRNTAALQEIGKSLDQNIVISDDRFLRAYADVGDYNSVLAIINARIAKDPDNIQNKLTLASAYATMGQKQKAIDVINAIIAEHPDFKSQGEVYLKQLEAK